jgi:hypothetical protein
VGHSQKEICELLEVHIPKSTLAGWVKNIELSREVRALKEKSNLIHLQHARSQATEVLRQRKNTEQELLYKELAPIAKQIIDSSTAKVSLALLYWAEGSKSTSFYFANSNPKIVTSYLKLLERCYGISTDNLRFTVQCRADQNTVELEAYWRNVINSLEAKFYTAQVDPRTRNKPTLKLDYKGVLRIDCFNAKIRRELEALVELVFQTLVGP